MKFLFNQVVKTGQKSAAIVAAIAIVISSAYAVKAATVSFVLKDSNKAINVWLNSNANYRFDGYQRAFVTGYDQNDKEQRFNELPGNRGGNLYRVEGTNLCLNNGYNRNGAPINVWPCDANDQDQNWRKINLAGSIHLQNVATNRCADSPTRNLDPNNLHVWDCMAGNPNQQFNVYTIEQSTNSTGQISLPFASGQTWYVCQGYNGAVSHKGNPALDLTVAKDFGSNACWATDGNVNKSAGKPVLAPANGKIVNVGVSDMVCLQLDNRRSILIGHINRTVGYGEDVSEGRQIGTVAQAANPNGGYAHIHIEARQSASCARGTAVPFTSEYGFQFRGVGDLPGNQTHFTRELRKP